MVYLDLGNFECAAYDFSQSEVIIRNDMELQEDQKRHVKDKQDKEESEEKIVDLSPSLASAQLYLAKAKLKAGEYQQAIDDF